MHTPRSRDRSAALLAALTGSITAGTVAATGLACGVAAHATALRDRARELRARDAAVTPVVVRPAPQPRPTRTVVTTRIIRLTSAPGTARVGGGTHSTPGGPSVVPRLVSPRQVSRPAAPAPAVAPARPAAPAPPAAPARPPVTTSAS